MWARWTMSMNIITSARDEILFKAHHGCAAPIPNGRQYYSRNMGRPTARKWSSCERILYPHILAHLLMIEDKNVITKKARPLHPISRISFSTLDWGTYCVLERQSWSFIGGSARDIGPKATFEKWSHWDRDKSNKIGYGYERRHEATWRRRW